MVYVVNLRKKIRSPSGCNDEMINSTSPVLFGTVSTRGSVLAMRMGHIINFVMVAGTLVINPDSIAML